MGIKPLRKIEVYNIMLKQCSNYSLKVSTSKRKMTLGIIITKVKEYHGPAAAAKSLQSCPTLCDPINGSPSGSTVPGILQARTLEWVAISFSNA